MSFGSVTGFLTGGLIDPSTPDYAGSAMRAENRRKGLIKQGMRNINAVFGGGTTDVYAPVANQLSRSEFRSGVGDLYKLNPKGKFRPYTLGFSDDFMGDFRNAMGSRRNWLNENIRAGNIFTGEKKTFEGFTPDFYNDAAKAYVDAVLPDLGRQYRRAEEDITFGLANRGLLKSTAQEKAMSDLNITAGQQRQQVADNARATAQNLRQAVENARQQAIAQLYQTADPAEGLRSAVAMASQFKVPQSFTPILNAFGNIANQYAMSRVLNNYTPSIYGAGYDMPGTNVGALGGVEL